MVTALARWVKRSAAPPRPSLKSRHGLKVYDVRRAGGRRRFHLRADADGGAVLMIDVTDAIHLNPSASLLARLALEGVSVKRAAGVLRRRFRGLDGKEARAAAQRVYALIERLTDLSGACPACGLVEDNIKWSPPFSVPVSAPYKADLALTYGCNNRCAHCYNQCSRTAAPGAAVPGRFNNDAAFLSVKHWRKILRRMAEIGVPHVVFTGGEPTLYDGLPELVRRATELGLVSGLNTNGRRLSDPALVRSLAEAGLDHVQITLQSHDPALHDEISGAAAFEETINGLKNSLAAGLHTITNTTLTRRNVAGAGRMVEFLHGLGLRTFAMNGMIFAGGGRTCGEEIAPEELAPVLVEVRDRAAELRMRFLWYTPTEYCRLSPLELELGPRRCNAGEYSICIEPNGNVIPCQSYYVPAGNILRDRWEDIWESELFRRFRRRTADPRAAGLPERCWDCPDLPACGGGCPLEREHNKVRT
ncbi:MAG: radical SAM protein [Pirellulales bacterium]|nr:radical SAM protein [Pirellulales bacterium]